MGTNKYKIIINDKNIYVFYDEPEYETFVYNIKNYKNIFIYLKKKFRRCIFFITSLYERPIILFF